MQQNLEALSQQNIAVALLVILALIWVVKQFMDFVITLRALRKPQEKEAVEFASHQAECERRFRNDRTRLDKLEPRVDEVEQGQKVLCKGVYEILGHLLHNGNKDAMEQASSDLFDFLNR